MENNKPHKYKDLIIAWANGAKIQYKNLLFGDDKWIDIHRPSWVENSSIEYRIKPQEDPYKELREAHAEGKTIQILWNGLKNDWLDLPRPNFTQHPTWYRIKPETKLVPFTWEDREQLRNKWVKFKSNPTSEFNINSLKILADGTFYIQGYSAKTLLNAVTFLDGTPFGKYIEE